MRRRKGRRAKSMVAKRTVSIAGHKTSVSLEDAFWQSLKEIASERDMTRYELIAAIDSERQHGNLSSVIRLFVLDFYQQQIPVSKRAAPDISALAPTKPRSSARSRRAGRSRRRAPDTIKT